MLSLLTRIMDGFAQSDALKSQARLLYAQARNTRNQAYGQAALIEDSARRNLLIDADNLAAAAGNKRETLAALKNKRATSGFTSQGTGDAPIRTAAQELQAEIDQMALSASINSLNAVQTANDIRTQGRLDARIMQLQAESLRTQAKGIQKSTILSGIIGTATAAYTGYQEYNAETNLDHAYDTGQINADQYAAAKNNLAATDPWLRAIVSGGQYGTAAYEFTASFNPYTATMTRKNPWGNLYTLAKGANPGITRSNYSQLFTR